MGKYADLTPESRVLEIGCGCGRTAVALAGILRGDTYTGMDIERESLEAARRALPKFTFTLLDIQNDEYNPDGRYSASDYIMPYEPASFDVVFLVSVFTHMRTADVRHYIEEIARLLAGGGYACLPPSSWIAAARQAA